MKIQKLILNNFRAIKHLELELNGMDMLICGRNGVGKTTIYNAFTWLLTGKSCNGEKDFSPKVLDENGNEIHHIESSVKGIFQLDDGKIISLQRELVEKHTKKKGTGETVFEGNTIKYYVDGVPSKKREFENKIESIISADDLKVLSMPEYFSTILPWQNRRKLLMRIAGDELTQEQIIAAKPELKDLPAMLESYGYSYDVTQLLKVAKEEKKGITKDLEQIPVRISEVYGMADDTISESDGESIKEALAATEDSIAELRLRKAAVSTSDAKLKKMNEHSEIEAEMIKWEARYEDYSGAEDLKNRIKEKEKAAAENVENAKLVKIQTEMIQTRVNLLKSNRNNLISQYNATAAEKWEGDTICPYCGQPIPEEKLKEAVEKFNIQKSEKLAEINKKGASCSKEVIQAAQNELKEKQEICDTYLSKAKTLTEESEGLKIKLDAIPEWEESDKYREVKARLDQVKAEIASTPSEDALKAEYDEKISELEKQAAGYKKTLDQIAKNADAKKRIKQLEEQEKEFSASLEQAERKIALCEQYIIAKTEMLTVNVNNHFENVKFRLFEHNLNGGFSECCEVMVPCESGLIPYGQANQGSKMRAGLEIIRELSDLWNKRVPVFIDNSESYTWLPKMNTQVIELRVTEDEEMKIQIK